MISKRECQLGFHTLQGTVNVVFYLCLFLKSTSICWGPEMDAWAFRHLAGAFQGRLMRPNGASDLVLRAVKTKLTLFKSVMFCNFLQKKKSFQLFPRDGCFHCPRTPSSLQLTKSYLLWSLKSWSLSVNQESCLVDIFNILIWDISNLHKSTGNKEMNLRYSSPSPRKYRLVVTCHHTAPTAPPLPGLFERNLCILCKYHSVFPQKGNDTFQTYS